MGDEGVPAGWYPDPMARHEYRYWDGARWTDEVADQGSATLDPLADTMARPVATPQTVAGPPPAWPVPVRDSAATREEACIHRTGSRARRYRRPGGRGCGCGQHVVE